MGDAAKPILLCALRHERRAMVRAGLGASWSIAHCGTGAAAVQRWADRHGPGSRAAVVLCGLAGALSAAVEVRQARIIGAVVDETGGRWRPSWPAGGTGLGQPVTVVSVARLICGDDERRVLALSSEAEVVDQESAAFAAVATERSWLWTIVRGVSDGPGRPLPPACARWVGASGRTRPAMVALDLVRGRVSAGELARIASDSRAALGAAAALVERLRPHG